MESQRVDPALQVKRELEVWMNLNEAERDEGDHRSDFVELMGDGVIRLRSSKRELARLGEFASSG